MSLSTGEQRLWDGIIHNEQIDFEAAVESGDAPQTLFVQDLPETPGQMMFAMTDYDHGVYGKDFDRAMEYVDMLRTLDRKDAQALLAELPVEEKNGGFLLKLIYPGERQHRA